MSLLKKFLFMCLLLISAKPEIVQAQVTIPQKGSIKKEVESNSGSPYAPEKKNQKSELRNLLRSRAEAREIGDVYKEAKLDLEIARCCKREGLTKDCLDFLKKGVGKLSENNLLDDLPEFYYELATTYKFFGYDNSAIDACQKGLLILDSIMNLKEQSVEWRENEKIRSRFLNKIAEYSEEQGDDHRVLLSYQKLKKILEKDEQSQDYCKVLNNLGVAFLRSSPEYSDSAGRYFRKAIAILEQLDAIEKKTGKIKPEDKRYISNLAEFKINLAHSLIQQRKYAAAQTELNNSMVLCRQHKLFPFESEIYCFNSIILLSKNDLQGALRASQTAVKLANKIIDSKIKVRYQKQALERHAQILKRLGDFREANDVYRELADLISVELSEQRNKFKAERQSRENERMLKEQLETLEDMSNSFELDIKKKNDEIERKRFLDSVNYVAVKKDRQSDSINFQLRLFTYQQSANQKAINQRLRELSLKDKLKDIALKRAINEKKIIELESKRKKDKEERKKIQDAKNNALRDKQLFAIFGVSALALFAVAAYFGLDSMRKNRRLKEGQKQIESANLALGNLNRQLSGKNKNITDSIQYARGIQAAILPGENRWKEAFPDSFVYYAPRDIVSGDFYFLSSFEDKHIMAFADCTGHGVPGALMSIIGHNLLTSAIDLHELSNPAEILSFLDQGLRNTLQQDGQDSQDGMEVGICIFDLKNSRLEFAGSRRPLFGMKDGEFFEWKGDRHYLGSGKTVFRNFTNYSCGMDKLTEVWLSSDGYPDQFGGPELKRFNSGQLKKVLASLSGQSAESQKEVMAKTFTDWKMNTAQLDDVMLIGIRPEAMLKS